MQPLCEIFPDYDQERSHYRHPRGREFKNSKYLQNRSRVGKVLNYSIATLISGNLRGMIYANEDMRL